MKIKIRILVQLIIIFSSISLYSQHTLCGKVMNQKGEALYPASIQLKDSKSAVSTENDGSFCIQIKNSGILKVSFVGYETTLIQLNIKDSTKMIFRTIVLKEKTLELPEFEVSAKLLKIVTREKDIWVRDYEFMGNNILTLSIKENERKLSLITPDDSLIWELKVKDGMYRCTKFYKDFLSNTYLLSDDSAFQITNKDKEIYIFPGIAIADFNKTILSSLALCNQQIVYRVYGPHNKSVYYYLINNGKRKLVFSNRDVDSESYSDMFFKDKVLKKTKSFPSYDGNMRIGTNLFDEDFYRKILIHPIEIHLFKIEDYIYIFDHFESKMSVYNCDAKLLSEVPVYYPKRKDIVAKQLILANNKMNVYAVFNKDGIYSLQQIDLNTGLLKGNEVRINFPFVERIEIQDNYIYFLYRKNKEDARKLLYKIDLM
jgi:hypothetical protein